MDYKSDEQTYLLNFDEFFKMFDEDILPLCHGDAQIKKYLISAVLAYINAEWPDFVESVKEETRNGL